MLAGAVTEDTNPDSDSASSADYLPRVVGPLHTAILYGTAADVAAAVAAGCDINGLWDTDPADGQFLTILNWAAAGSELRKLRALMAAPNVTEALNFRDVLGFTPAMTLAASPHYNDAEIFAGLSLFAAHGADLSTIDIDGISLLEHLRRYRKPRSYRYVQAALEIGLDPCQLAVASGNRAPILANPETYNTPLWPTLEQWWTGKQAEGWCRPSIVSYIGRFLTVTPEQAKLLDDLVGAPELL